MGSDISEENLGDAAEEYSGQIDGMLSKEASAEKGEPKMVR